MTDEERKALVEYLREQAVYTDCTSDEVAFTEAADQIEADGQRIAELEIGVRNAQGDVVHACKCILELERHVDALADWIEAVAIVGAPTVGAWKLADKLLTKARAALGGKAND